LGNMSVFVCVGFHYFEQREIVHSVHIILSAGVMSSLSGGGLGICDGWEIYIAETGHDETCVLLYHKDYTVGEKGKKISVEVGMNKSS